MILIECARQQELIYNSHGGLTLHHVIPPNICVERLFPLNMESYQLTFSNKNDVILETCDVNIFQNVAHKH